MPKILENVAEDILRVSRDLILKEGYSNVSIRKIASACGVSTGTIYNYYKSKDEILVSIIKDEWNTIIKKVDIIIKNNTDYIYSLKKIYLEVQYFMNVVHFISLNNLTTSLSPDKFLELKQSKKQYRNQLSEKICQCLKDLNIPKENDLVYNLLVDMFFTYSRDESVTFDDLIPYINKLLN